MSASPSELDALQQAIGYCFRDTALLVRALTHPSYIQQVPEAGEHNQRLEFLGDAVLSLILAERLFATQPGEREGVLTRNRAALARGAHLAQRARQLGLTEHLRLSDAEVLHGGRDRDSILEDAFEALIAAIYLDSDFATTRAVVLPWYGDLREILDRPQREHNPKGRLQELIQPHLGNQAIRYEVMGAEGPDHAKVFTAQVLIQGEAWGTGAGSSKKAAEEEAARAAMTRAEILAAAGEVRPALSE